MIRNIVGSWLLAAFLVVVAVGTWRLLDAGRSSCTRGSCPHAVVVSADAPPIAHTCGSASAPLDEPPPPPVEPAHTCGAGADPIDGQLDAHDPFEPVVPAAAQPKHTLSEDEAQAEFEFVVEHLRMRDNATACFHLKHLIDNSHNDSRWHEKSQMLFSRRCAP